MGHRKGGRRVVCGQLELKEKNESWGKGGWGFYCAQNSFLIFHRSWLYGVGEFPMLSWFFLNLSSNLLYLRNQIMFSERLKTCLCSVTQASWNVRQDIRYISVLFTYPKNILYIYNKRYEGACFIKMFISLLLYHKSEITLPKERKHYVITTRMW